LRVQALTCSAPTLGVLASVIALSGACASAGPVSPAAGPAPVRLEAARPSVLVQRDGDNWTADFTLDRDAPVWAFIRSEVVEGTRRPWRLEQWRVTTPGVVLDRINDHDVLRATDGGPVPRRVRIALHPRSVDLEAGYGSLAFTTGAVALPSMQFDLFPTTLDRVRRLPGDLNGVDLGAETPRVVWRDRAGPVLLDGGRVTEAVTQDRTAYVLFGQVETLEASDMVVMMDPALPSWIGRQVGSFAPQVGAYYARRLGPGQTDHPTVMISWRGPTERMTSMGGSVVPGVIVMSFEGSGVVNPTPEMLSVSRWFIGHESAHFWLGQSVRYEFARDMWITEGGADLMAVRALQTIDPAYDARGELQKEIDDCVSLSTGRAVVTASERGEHRAYYACGAVFAMAAEAAQKQRTGGDWFDFLKPLLRQPDGVLSREEWLTALTRVSRDPSLRGDVERLLDRGADDPSAVIARLFQRTGVAFRMEGGRVVLT
jgi:hypothetical protein